MRDHPTHHQRCKQSTAYLSGQRRARKDLTGVRISCRMAETDRPRVSHYPDRANLPMDHNLDALGLCLFTRLIHRFRLKYRAPISSFHGISVQRHG